MEYLCCQQKPILVFGHWKMNPQRLMQEAQSWLDEMRAELLEPCSIDATCAGSAIVVFAFVSKGSRLAMSGLGQAGAVPWRPHTGVSVQVNRVKLQTHIRVL